MYTYGSDENQRLSINNFILVIPGSVRTWPPLPLPYPVIPSPTGSHGHVLRQSGPTRLESLHLLLVHFACTHLILHDQQLFLQEK